MQKRSILFLLIISLTGYGTFAQHFMQSAGIAFSILTGKISTPAESYTATVSFANFTYFPKFTVTESENSSISIGIPFGLGVGIATSTGYGETSVYYGGDLPLVIDYNRGKKSTNDNDDKFGWYVGTGFGYALTNWTDGSSTAKLNSYGPLIRAGIRLTGGSSNHPTRATTVGFSFKTGLESTKFKTIGIAAMIEF